MTAKKFDLLVCKFPGGYSYTNKAVMEHGDYKKIAFIDHYGHLRLDVPVSYIPGDVLTRIEHDADTITANFKKDWETLPELTKFMRLYDMAPLKAVLRMPNTLTRDEKIDFLEYAVFGWVPHSEKVSDLITINNIVPYKWI